MEHLFLRKRRNVNCWNRFSFKQNNFDDKFFKEVNSECQNIKDNLKTLDGRENFNSDIVYQEVEAAIQKIKAGEFEESNFIHLQHLLDRRTTPINLEKC